MPLPRATSPAVVSHTAVLGGHPGVPPSAQNGKWINLHDQYVLKVMEGQTLNVSPVDAKGRCHALVWDIDAGEEGNVQKLLSVLPEGCRPLVSLSGKKGWHVWLLPERPISVSDALIIGKGRSRKKRCQMRILPNRQKLKTDKVAGVPTSRNKSAGSVRAPGCIKRRRNI
ncbi:MAG TPA: hypothetical protein GXX40_02760 [Firmicutes bacterium]|nr:hypothetical protein [Bacillota bacterium]